MKYVIILIVAIMLSGCWARTPISIFVYLGDGAQCGDIEILMEAAQDFQQKDTGNPQADLTVPLSITP